jgi:hypothetical protein
MPQIRMNIPDKLDKRIRIEKEMKDKKTKEDMILEIISEHYEQKQ